MENAVGCKKIEIESYLSMIENNPVIAEKLKQLGLENVEDRLAVPLNYYDLLTDEDKKVLAREMKKFIYKKPIEGLFYKLNNTPNSVKMCTTDIICDFCYKGLIERRTYYKKK
ncbi:conserved hypothetical protein [Flavobacterium sp. 9AF]|uniref:hypothetical protein n=1 Tax=Flavobacterium sp. 9AF TaxID=2653142 RepID=UPI0012F32F93|nr:hypothetical protein [Flavobacterium sp. 9AF]VXB28731.1 conserved hypothetical protein [Flavobacterium sp. 9AF]